MTTNLVMSVADHSVSDYRSPSPRDEEQGMMNAISFPLFPSHWYQGERVKKFKGMKNPA